jgi:hypothetical protein
MHDVASAFPRTVSVGRVLVEEVLDLKPDEADLVANAHQFHLTVAAEPRMGNPSGDFCPVAYTTSIAFLRGTKNSGRKRTV